MKKIAIGCGVLALITIGLGIAGVYLFSRWAEDHFPDTGAAARIRTELDATYGPADEYVPPVDGAYDPERVAVFVDVREQLHPHLLATAAEIDGIFERATSASDGGFRGFFSQMGSAIGAMGGLLHQSAVTDSLLLGHGMGRGEYDHLRLVLTRGWFDTDALRAEWESALAGQEKESEGLAALHEFLEESEQHASETLRRHLANLDGALGADAPDSVRAYVDTIDADRDFPFTNPVPPALATAFEAHAVRLRATIPATFGAWIAEGADLIDEEGSDGSSTRVQFEF